MSDIIAGFTNLIRSFFQIITGTISTAVSTVTTAISTAVNFVVGVFSNIFNLAEGVVGLVLGNFVIILSAVVAYFAYIQYQKNQGNRNPQPLADAKAKLKK